jgi:Lon protease-like protein
MFPLGSPLLPTMLLPLRIFEPRYDVLIRRVLDGDRQFGVVMIERGSEVGGGEARTDIGCVADIVEAEEQAPGQWAVLAGGSERMRVSAWFADDPHPVASVELWPDDPSDPGEVIPIEPLLSAHAALMAAVTESRPDLVPPRIELGDDPAEIVYQLAVASPLGALDRYRLLSTPSVRSRAKALTGELIDLEAVLRTELDG